MLKKTCFKKRYHGLLLASMLAILALTSSAGAHPEMPHTLYGYVANATDGETITAVVNSAPASSTITDGWYVNLDVPADDRDSPEVEGGTGGDIAYFYIDGRSVGTFVFNTGGFDRLEAHANMT